MSGAGCGTITRPLRLKVLPAETRAPGGSRPTAASFMWGKARPRDPVFLGSFQLAIVASQLPVAAEFRESPPAEPAEVGLYPEFRRAPLPIAAPDVPDRFLPIIVEPGADDAPPVEAPLPPMPEAGFLPVELHCRNKAGAVWGNLEPDPAVCPSLPPFAVPAALVDLQDLAAAKAGRVPPAAAAPVQHRKVSAATSRAIKALAAALVMAVSAWFGSGTLRSTRPESAMVGDAQPEESRPSPALEAARVPAGGPVEWVRNAMVQRAAIEFRESFRDDAGSWQDAANGSPAGWAHYPQGYVKPGPLVLYRPSLGFTDYRFEFFGQIETKSMGWVVRAQDRQNYYATKVKVVKPGLRPMIAIEHYAVVAGKPGHRVEIPLNVMVHNDMPYHVAVVVRGHHLITSIEDQEVDTWTDESLVAGGVGFFSEAGESARLYWMRLTKNQDIWGRVCAYISRGAASIYETAALGPLPAAVLPRRRFAGGPMRAPHGGQGRMEAWKC